jgi:hypothetical protein
MERQFPEMAEQLAEHRFQIVVPAYREGESIDHFLGLLKEQREADPTAEWGVTIVLNYAIPMAQQMESAAKQEVQDKIDAFLVNNPDMKGHLNYFFYYRRKDPAATMLPVALSRKVGEDVTMYQRMQQSLSKNSEAPLEQPPLYLGMMDIDTGDLSPGVFNEVVQAINKKPEESAVIVRARGAFDRRDLKDHPSIFPLEMMWEGITSQVGRKSDHNPFNMGRFSAIPARELALTGGCFVGKLEFPDEDIRHGIQIAWQLPDVHTIEVDGGYTTSARREIGAVRDVAALVEHTKGAFTLQAMEVAALIRMYGNWGNELIRGKLSIDQAPDADVYEDQKKFNKALPHDLIETTVNAFYRFTAFSIYAVDVLAQAGGAPEVAQWREEFLRAEKPYFRVQLDTLQLIRDISKNNPVEFERLKPLLAEVDAKARTAVREVLNENHVNYTVDESVGTIYGVLEEPEEGQERDHTVLQAPFKISEDQTRLASYIAQQLGDQ